MDWLCACENKVVADLTIGASVHVIGRYKTNFSANWSTFIQNESIAIARKELRTVVIHIKQADDNR